MMRLSFCVAAWLALVPAARAQIFWPILHGAAPCAVQQGQTIECAYGASNNGSKDVYQVLVSGKGVSGAIAPLGDPKALAAPPASTVAAGAALTFHMYCQRLQAKLTSMTYHADPLLALRNAAGTVLATNDNFFGVDPLLHYRFATAGEYFLEVRDVRYHGYRSWDYAI